MSHGTELEKEVSWTIRTPKLALQHSVPAENWSTHVRLDQPVLLRFNQSVDAGILRPSRPTVLSAAQSAFRTS